MMNGIESAEKAGHERREGAPFGSALSGMLHGTKRSHHTPSGKKDASSPPIAADSTSSLHSPTEQRPSTYLRVIGFDGEIQRQQVSNDHPTRGQVLTNSYRASQDQQMPSAGEIREQLQARHAQFLAERQLIQDRAEHDEECTLRGTERSPSASPRLSFSDLYLQDSDLSDSEYD